MKKEMKLEACIFDLDGVIVDTARHHYISWQKLSRHLGFEFPESENEKLKGINRMASLEIVLEFGQIQKSYTEKEELCRLKNDWYLDIIQDLGPNDALEGVRPLLQELRNQGIKIALGSASKNARMVLQSLELTKNFDSIVDGTDVLRSKPDPEVFIKAAELLDVAHANTIVFEDAEKGLDAALSGGFKTIGIGTDPSLQKADYVFPNFKELDLNKIKSVFSLS